ncbi:hypothetical protein D3C76_1420870 [compost metagenome]
MRALALMNQLADRLQNPQQLRFNLLEGFTGEQLPDQIITRVHFLPVIRFNLLGGLQHRADQLEHQAAGQLYGKGLPGKIGHEDLIHDFGGAGIVA